jgi:hypothetical protein
LNDIVVPSARSVSFNSQYNFKVIILFYLFRVGCAFVQLRKQANGSHFRFRFQTFTSINPIRFAHSWVDKKLVTTSLTADVRDQDQPSQKLVKCDRRQSHICFRLVGYDTKHLEYF